MFKFPRGTEEEEKASERRRAKKLRSDEMGKASLHSALTAMWDALKEISSRHGSAAAWTDALAYLVYAEAALALSEQCVPGLEGRRESMEKCRLLIAAAPEEGRKEFLEHSSSSFVTRLTLTPKT